MIFETARLVVRKLEDADFAAFRDMQSDDEVMRYTTGKGFDETENRRQLASCIAQYLRSDNDFWGWAIVRKLDQQFVGTCAIVPNESRPEIGYRFRRKFFGNGYGQEVCNGLIEFGISQQGLKEIVAFVDIRIVASTRILDRSRLTFVEEIRNEDGVIDRFYRWQPLCQLARGCRSHARECTDCDRILLLVESGSHINPRFIFPIATLIVTGFAEPPRDRVAIKIPFI